MPTSNKASTSNKKKVSTLLAKRRKLLKGRYENMDDSLEDSSDDDYEPTDSETESDVESDDNDTGVENDKNGLSSTMSANCDDEWIAPNGSHQKLTFNSGSVDNRLQGVGDCNPQTFYNFFLDDEIITLMVDETNRYAPQYMEGNTLTPESRMQDWVDTNPIEMSQFCALMIWMGMVRMPSIECYWKRTTLYSNEIANKVMTRNRFQILKKIGISQTTMKPMEIGHIKSTV